MTKTATTYIRPGHLSLDAQRELCRQAADRLGVTITAEYIERAEGQVRPERERMLRELADERHTDLLLIASDDRLARQPRDWYRIKDRLHKANVQLVVAELVRGGLSLAGLRLVQRIHESFTHQLDSKRGQTQRKVQG